ncbi:unnamed protein product [Dicrocoelium dendriticum]|nr:unnamed protein product [Dicrocoelium dendriticum]
MDHSYCSPAWSLTECNNHLRVSDLLTDHTYALPSGFTFPSRFDTEQEWDPQRISLVTSEDTSPIDDRHVTGLHHPILNRLFSQVELRIRDTINVSCVKDLLSEFRSILCMDESTITGLPSEIFALLMKLASAGSVALHTPDPAPDTRPVCDPMTTPPVHITLVKTEEKCRRRLHSKRYRAEKSKESHTCPLCHLTFSRKSSLSEHTRMVHEKNPRYRCPHCDHGFKRPALLRDHMYSKHLRIRRLFCPICHKGFIRRRDWSRHHVKRHSTSACRPT